MSYQQPHGYPSQRSPGGFGQVPPPGQGQPPPSKPKRFPWIRALLLLFAFVVAFRVAQTSPIVAAVIVILGAALAAGVGIGIFAKDPPAPAVALAVLARRAPLAVGITLAILLVSGSLGFAIRPGEQGKAPPLTEQKAAPGAAGQETPTPSTPAALDAQTSAPRALPPEPPPPVADKIGEVPGLEAKLAQDKAYQALWTGPRDSLSLFLTFVSELWAEGAAPVAITKPLRERGLHPSAVNLYLIVSRAGRFPEDFTARVGAHLDTVKAEPRRGTWLPAKSGGVPYDFTALAAWLRQSDPGYLRERLQAKREGPIRWSLEPRKERPLRPWLVEPKASIERLALVTDVTAADCAAVDLELIVKVAKDTGRLQPSCGLPTNGRATDTQYGADWPLKVPSGRLVCVPPSIALFRSEDGTNYALNGMAENCINNPDHPVCAKLNVKPIEPLWRDNTSHPGMGLKISIQPLIADALALCKK
jgi:hypothetical protein